jgi:hypothetical protein
LNFLEMRMSAARRNNDGPRSINDEIRAPWIAAQQFADRLAREVRADLDDVQKMLASMERTRLASTARADTARRRAAADLSTQVNGFLNQCDADRRRSSAQRRRAADADAARRVKFADTLRSDIATLVTDLARERAERQQAMAKEMMAFCDFIRAEADRMCTGSTRPTPRPRGAARSTPRTTSGPRRSGAVASAVNAARGSTNEESGTSGPAPAAKPARTPRRD